MKYIYVALAVAAVVLLIVLIICLFLHLRKRWAYKKVKSQGCEEKASRLNDALAPFGFVYLKAGDLIGSGMYPWQREMGYCKEYDEAAPAMSMIFDSEPVYFDYDGKRWLIELWKGQYGCTTGAEIGVYVNRSGNYKARPEDLFYQCADDEERLHLEFTLYKDNRMIVYRQGCHWWLTGFLVGEYSRPDELVMEVSISFPTVEMRNAYYEGLLRAGYRPSEICLNQCRVSILFDSPCTRQYSRFCRLYIHYVNARNRRNCRIFRRVTRRFKCMLDKITYIGYCFPCLYRKLIRIGTKCNRHKLKKYAKRFHNF